MDETECVSCKCIMLFVSPMPNSTACGGRVAVRADQNNCLCLSDNHDGIECKTDYFISICLTNMVIYYGNDVIILKNSSYFPKTTMVTDVFYGGIQ